MQPLSTVVTVWALLASGFTVVVLFSIWRTGRAMGRVSAPARWPSIWLLRPCQGDEPGLAENLSSSLSRYPGPRHVLLLVPAADDAAYPIAQRIAAGRSDVELVVTHPDGVANRKSAQLAHGLALAAAAAAPPEVIVQADSDVRLDDESLPALIAALVATPSHAAAFAAPVELDGFTGGDFAAEGLLSASTQDFLCLHGLAGLSGGVPALAGALAAHRRERLEESGGFASLTHLLGEDYEIGRRLRARGLTIAVAASPARSPDRGRSLAQVLARTARWAMVVKQQRGLLIASYPLLLAPTPLLLVAGLGFALAGDAQPLGAGLGLLATRTLLALRLRRLHRAPVGPQRALALVLAGEALMLAASSIALVTRDVTWRGRRLRVGRGGVIDPPGDVPVPPPASMA